MSVKMRTTRAWTVRPYEALLHFDIEIFFYLRRIGGKRGFYSFGNKGVNSEIPL